RIAESHRTASSAAPRSSRTVILPVRILEIRIPPRVYGGHDAWDFKTRRIGIERAHLDPERGRRIPPGPFLAPQVGFWKLLLFFIKELALRQFIGENERRRTDLHRA